MFGWLAKSKIEKVFGVPVIWVKNYAETEEILETAKEGFSMALLDFNLPDAPNGELFKVAQRYCRPAYLCNQCYN